MTEFRLPVCANVLGILFQDRKILKLFGQSKTCVGVNETKSEIASMLKKTTLLDSRQAAQEFKSPTATIYLLPDC